MDLLGGDIRLRSKRELIEKFIKEHLPLIDDADNIQDEFGKYWQEQKLLALGKLCEEEHLDKEQFKALIDAYIFSGQDHYAKKFSDASGIGQAFCRLVPLVKGLLQR